MEVFVSAPSFRFSNFEFPDGSVVGDVLNRFVQDQGVSSHDFYVVTNGRLSGFEDPLQHGAVYHLEPRLYGGKGGFGSMLRALGAQIEKTTNREACRDLSGRRLRDVNHEKEMAEWLKKQADREAEKEQRRLERLQKKLAEPKHQFTDPEFQQQCHDLSERLEDSVLKGLQASSSSQVKVDDVSAVKRPNSDQSQQPQKKKKTNMTGAACFWSGLGELLSSEDDEDEDDSPSTSSSSCGAAAVTTQTQEVAPSTSRFAPAITMTTQKEEPEQSSSSSVTDNHTSTPAQAGAGREPAAEDKMEAAGAGREPAAEDKMEAAGAGREPAERDQTTRPSPSSHCEQQQGPPPLDLSSVSSVEQLESLGLEVLKQELMSRGLKCGGTLPERAARLFSVRGLTPDHIDPALLAKPGKSRRK
ncbi:replication stress response regulator SDE2 [Anabas testudineus]|uniref:Replication stress response regulator SDE2 n=1 Tax=Anabas testudineus TaxID=64144 RepID=A0A3Q1IS20_ANATE|nr:replication stress response regulator SDE2 [Anabas testudineus]